MSSVPKRYIRKDGSIIWTHASASVVRDDAGEPKYLVTAIVDLTEQKYSSEIIQKQYEQLQATFDLSSVGIVNVTFEGNYLRVNRKFCEIIGYSEEELLKMNFREITYPEDLETNLDTINRAIEDGYQFGIPLKNVIFGRIKQLFGLMLNQKSY